MGPIVCKIQYRFVCGLILIAAGAMTGCQTDNYAQRGTLLGGLTGAGVGALVGDSVGEAGAGAAIGAGVGALTGAAIGDSLDEIDAKNRAQIAAHMGRAVQPGAATLDDVVSMSRAGVDKRLIVSHIRNNGVAAPVTATDVIFLHEQGVPTEVIEAMQAPPPRPVVAQQPPPQRVIVEERHYDYGPPRVYHQFYGRPRHARSPRVGWGFSFWN